MDGSDKRTSEDFALWVIQTRLEQGLPPHVEDQQTLKQVVELLGLAEESPAGEQTC